MFLDFLGEHAREKCELQRVALSSLSIVSCVGMTSFDSLMQIRGGLVALFTETFEHFARMSWMHAVVARAGGEEHHGKFGLLCKRNVVIRAPFSQKLVNLVL